MNRNKSNHDEQNYSGLFLTIAAGGILGAAAALFLTSEAGGTFRKKLYETYETLSEKAEDYSEEFIAKGKKAMNQASEFADSFRGKASDYAGSYADNLKGKAQELYENIQDYPISGNHLIIGAIALAVLGAATAAYMSKTSKNGQSFSEKVLSVDWVGKIKEILETVNQQPHSAEHHHSRPCKQCRNQINDALDLAVLGLRAWKSFAAHR